jgi:CDP-glucose 4,6-dehydratase
VDAAFWTGKRVFLTGHTGFKGSWLALCLHKLGAEVTGYALAPPTSPSLYEMAGVAAGLRDVRGDVRDLESLKRALAAAAPEVAIHMAAQSLVRPSYADPVGTYATNVMGTVNLLEAIRQAGSVRAAVVVTSDKCYENREWVWGYRENDPMGGFDPYSNSKGCAELVTAGYRNSFFAAGTALASARAGNVIGGGDWAEDRLVPDAMRAFAAGKPVEIRNPAAIRPWQHVLEPLSGYLMLAQQLFSNGQERASGWNFGPSGQDVRPVAEIVDRLAGLWGSSARWQLAQGAHPHEAHHLKLDCSKARAQLGWIPRIDLDEGLAWTSDWYLAWHAGADMARTTGAQIDKYLAMSR